MQADEPRGRRREVVLGECCWTGGGGCLCVERGEDFVGGGVWMGRMNSGHSCTARKKATLADDESSIISTKTI